MCIAVAAQRVELCQLLADNVRRVALVGLVVVEQDLVVLADEHELGRGASRSRCRDRRRPS